MDTLVDVGLHNAAMAVPFALIALAAGRWLKRPALTHALWLLVLIRLVLPPLWHVEVPGLEAVGPVVAQSVPGAETIAAPIDPLDASWDKATPPDSGALLAEEIAPPAEENPVEPTATPAIAHAPATPEQPPD